MKKLRRIISYPFLFIAMIFLGIWWIIFAEWKDYDCKNAQNKSRLY